MPEVIPPQRDASSAIVWPPAIYTSACLCAGLLYYFANLPLAPADAATILRPAGWLLIIIGIGIAGWAEIAFLMARTATLPIHPTTSIVSTGIYAWTRNPMYLGMSLFTGGAALALNSAWFLIALPMAMFGVTKLAIEPEEAYLERKVGQTYLDYKNKVRRWI